MKPELTRELAWAAAWDEGNRSMIRNRRRVWSREDRDAAAARFDELWPIEKDLEIADLEARGKI